jgi:hypothetical protein
MNVVRAHSSRCCILSDRYTCAGWVVLDDRRLGCTGSSHYLEAGHCKYRHNSLVANRFPVD